MTSSALKQDISPAEPTEPELGSPTQSQSNCTAKKHAPEDWKGVPLAEVTCTCERNRRQVFLDQIENGRKGRLTQERAYLT